MSLQSLIVLDSNQICILPELLREDFPGYSTSFYITNQAPARGDLCLVRSEGRQFFGFYYPRSRGADFARPALRIRAETFTIVAVLRPVVLMAGFYS